MLEQKHTVEFVKAYGDWRAGERAEFSAQYAANLEVHGFARIVGARIRQKAKKRKE